MSNRIVSALVTLTLGGACATEAVRPDDEAPQPDFVERGGDDVVPTTPIEPVAPIEPGTPSTPTPSTPLVPEHGAIGQPPAIKAEPIQVTIFNRYLVKPTEGSMPEGEIRRVVEEVLGAKVTLLRRTAVRYWLVQLEPTTPPRQAAEQKKVLEQLKATGLFAVVEPDQIMTIK